MRCVLGALRPWWHTVLQFTAGVAWALLLLVPGWLLSPRSVERRLVAEVYHDIAAGLRAIGTPGAGAARRSTTAALNVTVSWYVDKALVGTSTIAQIAANSDATVTFDYLPAGLSAGPHTVMVTADLDHDGVINQARGEVATSTLFYNQAVPPAPGWIILVGLAVFLPVLLGMVALRRRGQR